MTENNFDKKIGEKLHGYSEQPPRDMFSRIEATLEKTAPAAFPSKKRYTLRSVIRYAAAAVVLAGGVTLAVLLGEGPGLSPENTAQQILNTSTVEKVDAAELIRMEEQRAASPGSKNIAEVIREVINETNSLRGRTTPANTLAAATPHAETEPAPQPEEQEQSAPDPQAPKSFAEASADAVKRRRQYERDSNIENYWSDLFRDSPSQRQHGRNRNISASVYAGNFGTGSGDLVFRDPTMLASNNMLIKETYAIIPDGSDMVMSAEPPTRSMSSSSGGGEYTLRHYMPVSAGISITYPLSDRVSIVSGVNYSYLFSTTKQPLHNATGRIIQEQHYVGIPLGIMYSVYANRTLNLYVRAGGMIEKAVYATKRSEYQSQETTTEDGGKVKVPGFQPSVDAALGANIRLAKGIGLYVEPGIAYYFERTVPLASYRTENPTNFTVRVGVRFDL